MILVSLALFSWGATAQHDHSAHETKTNTEHDEPLFKNKALGTAYSHYLALKDALVASNQQEARKGAGVLSNALNDVQKAENALAEAKKVAQATTLERQRKAFTGLSNEMAVLVKGAEMSSGRTLPGILPDGQWQHRRLLVIQRKRSPQSLLWRQNAEMRYGERDDQLIVSTPKGSCLGVLFQCIHKSRLSEVRQRCSTYNTFAGLKHHCYLG
ncbi:Protein of unknown function [Cyclobacterium lianum]|uniref:DUF3347 domain-containing protein n=2 Tax=Cyclobacterium lianum TaxID=388280 RepID=A0A1M7M953_9BACT|nr:Protein of unknown function [Cyclobacterium lianum]